MESLLTTEIESPQISSYFKYEFSADGTVYYATNEFERGQGEPYLLTGNKLKMMGRTFTITSMTNDEMQMETVLAFTAIVHRSTLVKKSRYDQLWRLGTNNVEKTNVQPVFIGNFHLYDYVFSKYNSPAAFLKYSATYAYLSTPIPPKEDHFLRIDIVVDPAGHITVKDLRSSEEMNAKKLDRLKKKIEKTSGYWRAANSGSENTHQPITLTIVNRGKTSIQLKDRAIQNFKMAYQHYQKGDYHGAILRCTDAISLDQTKFQFYVLRAVCNIKLAEIDKYCKDVFMANALNPFVSLVNLEVVNGETLEIKCGER